MPTVSTARARWLAVNVLPLERQLRQWLERVVSRRLEVDDLVQEIYAKLAKLESVSHIAHPKAYVYQIAKHLISEHIRRSTVIPIEAMAETERHFASMVEGVTPERILSGRQELERLYNAIASLPDSCRIVFIMRKIDDMPQKAIAAQLRISENRVEKQLSRARRMLLEQLTRSESEIENAIGLGLVKCKDQRGA
jgi:RNA polymerase sigma factor (sigma-70 family)